MAAFASVFFVCFGAACLLYYLATIVAAKNATYALFWIWPAAILLSLSCAYVLMRTASNALASILLCGFAAAALAFGSVLAVLRRAALQADGRGKADWLIVLGAGIKGERIQLHLRSRLDAALAYWRAHPDVAVVVTGGQGPGETITEALAMKRYLVERGVSEDRVLMEERASNTRENLRFSRELVGGPNAYVAVLTSDFHIHRTMQLAAEEGYVHAVGVAAPSPSVTRFHYYVRECIAFMVRAIAKAVRLVARI